MLDLIADIGMKHDSFSDRGPPAFRGPSPERDMAVVIQSRKVPSVAPLALFGTGQSVLTAAAPVTPNGSSTKVHFSYGKTTAYGTNTADAMLAASRSASTASVKLVTLAPHTTYHLRAVATNFKGATIVSQIFKIPHTKEVPVKEKERGKRATGKAPPMRHHSHFDPKNL